MKFDVSARSADIRMPLHVFPGDGNVSPEQYERTIFSGYLSSVSTLYGGANAFGINVDSETFERWKRVAAAAGLIDDFLDNNRDFRGSKELLNCALDSGLGYLQDIPGYKTRKLYLAGCLLRNSVAILPEQVRDGLNASARKIGEISVAKAECVDIGDYRSLLVEEGAETARIICGTVSERISARSQMNLFSEWTHNALVAATLADGARDFWSDRLHGRHKVNSVIQGPAFLALSALDYFNELRETKESRAASKAALQERRKFSKLPTRLTMKVLK